MGFSRRRSDQRIRMDLVEVNFCFVTSEPPCLEDRPGGVSRDLLQPVLLYIHD